MLQRENAQCDIFQYAHVSVKPDCCHLCKVILSLSRSCPGVPSLSPKLVLALVQYLSELFRLTNLREDDFFLTGWLSADLVS